jgi:hypothetical protein
MTFAEFFPFYLRGLWLMIRQILPFLPFALMAAVPVARVLMRTIPRDGVGNPEVAGGDAERSDEPIRCLRYE